MAEFVKNDLKIVVLSEIERFPPTVIVNFMFMLIQGLAPVSYTKVLCIFLNHLGADKGPIWQLKEYTT